MIKKLLGVLFLGLAVFFAWRWFTQQGIKPLAPPGTAGKPAMMALPVKVERVRRERISAMIDAVGDLLAGESVVLRPEIVGRISSFRFEEGRRVKAGDLLIELNADEQRTAVSQSLAAVKLEQESFQRIRDVRVKNLISQQAYDESLARLQNAQALLERDRVRLSRTQLYAPFDGILGLRQVSLGDYVSPGQALVNLESVDPIKLDFRLPEKYAGKLAKGLKIEASVDAWPGRVFKGKIQAVDPKLDEATRTVRARARLANGDLALKPGMFARIVLDLGVEREAFFVPEQAVEAKGSQAMLFRVVDGKALSAPVKTGERRRGLVEVVEGVDGSEWVVIEGQLKIRDGMPVAIMNQAEP